MDIHPRLASSDVAQAARNLIRQLELFRIGRRRGRGKRQDPRHITGQEFCEGVRKYAIDQFGPMAGTVLEHWGIHETLDFGQIVFALVDIGLMRKTEEDSLNDFKNVYDFKKAFHSKVAFDS